MFQFRVKGTRDQSSLRTDHSTTPDSDFLTLVMGTYLPLFFSSITLTFLRLAGEFLYSVFSGSPARAGVHTSAGRAAMAVCIAFCFQLFYMQGGGSRAYIHPLRAVSWSRLCEKFES